MKRSTKLIAAGVLVGASLLAAGKYAHRHGGMEAHARDVHGERSGFDGAGEDAAFAMDDFERGEGWRGPRRHAHKMKRGKRKGFRRKLKRLVKLDVNKDGTVTQQEFLSRREKMFTFLDQDADGRLTPTEIVRPMKDRQNWKAERRIKRFDKNGDGRVTRQEVLDHVKARFAQHDLDGDGKITKDDLPPKMGKGKWRDRVKGWFGKGHLDRVEKRANRRFDKMDANGDGVVDKAEVLERTTSRVEFRQRKRMHRLDINKDGSVTQQEFMTKAQKRFALWDLDDSGAITKDDLPPVLAYFWQERLNAK